MIQICIQKEEQIKIIANSYLILWKIVWITLKKVLKKLLILILIIIIKKKK